MMINDDNCHCSYSTSCDNWISKNLITKHAEESFRRFFHKNAYVLIGENDFDFLI